MSKLSAARKFAARLAEKLHRPVFIWISKSGPERYFVFEIGRKPAEESEVFERYLPNVITKE